VLKNLPKVFSIHPRLLQTQLEAISAEWESNRIFNPLHFLIQYLVIVMKFWLILWLNLCHALLRIWQQNWLKALVQLFVYICNPTKKIN